VVVPPPSRVPNSGRSYPRIALRFIRGYAPPPFQGYQRRQAKGYRPAARP
jgi:hypothetical protein